MTEMQPLSPSMSSPVALPTPSPHAGAACLVINEFVAMQSRAISCDPPPLSQRARPRSAEVRELLAHALQGPVVAACSQPEV